MVLVDGILVDPRKIETTLEWQRPKIAEEVRSFLGLARDYMQVFVKLA